MIDPIVITVFIVWFFIGLLLSVIGMVIENCTTHSTNLVTIGMWVLIAWLIAVVIVETIILLKLIWV